MSASEVFARLRRPRRSQPAAPREHAPVEGGATAAHVTVVAPPELVPVFRPPADPRDGVHPPIPRDLSYKWCVPCGRREAAHVGGRCVMEYSHG